MFHLFSLVCNKSSAINPLPFSPCSNQLVTLFADTATPAQPQTLKLHFWGGTHKSTVCVSELQPVECIFRNTGFCCLKLFSICCSTRSNTEKPIKQKRADMIMISKIKAKMFAQFFYLSCEVGSRSALLCCEFPFTQTQPTKFRSWIMERIVVRETPSHDCEQVHHPHHLNHLTLCTCFTHFWTSVIFGGWSYATVFARESSSEFVMECWS